LADARVANRKDLYVPAVTKRLFLVVRDWLRYRPGLRDSNLAPGSRPKDWNSSGYASIQTRPSSTR
jgi:hypothetical protein